MHAAELWMDEIAPPPLVVITLPMFVSRPDIDRQRLEVHCELVSHGSTVLDDDRSPQIADLKFALERIAVT